MEVLTNLTENKTILFLIMFMLLTLSFHYLYKSANRFSLACSNEYKYNHGILALFDILAFLVSSIIIFEGLDFYKTLAYSLSYNDFFRTFIVPFPLFFVGLYPVIKNTIKYFKTPIK